MIGNFHLVIFCAFYHFINLCHRFTMCIGLYVATAACIFSCLNRRQKGIQFYQNVHMCMAAVVCIVQFYLSAVLSFWTSWHRATSPRSQGSILSENLLELCAPSEPSPCMKIQHQFGSSLVYDTFVKEHFLSTTFQLVKTVHIYICVSLTCNLKAETYLLYLSLLFFWQVLRSTKCH